jgi:preprotein translocase subunit SecY
MATALPNVGKASRYGDLKRRLLFLLAALVVFRIGAHIPCPGIDPNELAKLFEGIQRDVTIGDTCPERGCSVEIVSDAGKFQRSLFAI